MLGWRGRLNRGGAEAAKGRGAGVDDDGKSVGTGVGWVLTESFLDRIIFWGRIGSGAGVEGGSLRRVPMRNAGR
jgi:hypothetical protein